MSNLINIRKKLEQCPDCKLILNEPIQVNITAALPAFTCWGLSAGDQGVFLMDADQQWHGPLKTHQHNADILITGICNRLGLTKIIS